MTLLSKKQVDFIIDYLKLDLDSSKEKYELARKNDAYILTSKLYKDFPYRIVVKYKDGLMQNIDFINQELYDILMEVK